MNYEKYGTLSMYIVKKTIEKTTHLHHLRNLIKLQNLALIILLKIMCVGFFQEGMARTNYKTSSFSKNLFDVITF